MRLKLAAAIVLAGTLGGVQGTSAQPVYLPGIGNVASTTPITPFVVGGYIEKLTSGLPGGMGAGGNCATNPTTGAQITVNGQNFILPDNTIVVMPASQVAVCDLFDPKMQPANRPAAPGQTGLALSDAVPPLKAFEVSLIGNIVNGQWLVGLITIAQEFLNVHQGYITNIDYSAGTTGNGTFCMSSNPVPPTAFPPLSTTRRGCLPGEVRVKLNDPKGRYGVARTEGDQDPRFVVDDGNPTVHAATGYPMCIPRVAPPTVDPVCPIYNRPIDPPAGNVGALAPWAVGSITTFATGGGTGRPLTRFVMDDFNLPPVVPGAAPIIASTDIISCNAANGVRTTPGHVLTAAPKPACDSRQQVPMVLGDYVTVQSTYGNDGADFLSAWAVVATVAAYTKPCGRYGTNPFATPTLVATKCNPLVDITWLEWEVGEVGTQGAQADGGSIVEVQDRIKVLGFTTDPSTQIEIYAIDTLNNLRWIANVVPERIVFGRYALFIQRDIVRRVPVATTGGPVPIVDNHLGLDLGAPRQFYVHQARTEALLGGKQRPHNVKPIPGVCGSLIFGNCPVLNGTPVPQASDILPRVYGNGLMPSQYMQPIQAYIMPESVQMGDPIADSNFECLDFLVGGWAVHSPALDAANGGAGWTFTNGAGNPATKVGVNQLNPWPGGGLQGATAPLSALQTANPAPTPGPSTGVPLGVACFIRFPTGA